MGKDDKNQVAGKTPDELLTRAYALGEKEDARVLYRDWAETYDRHLVDELGYTLPGDVAACFARVVANREARVMDIGCGTGLTGLALSRHGFERIDGLDFSPEMLAEARRKGVYGELVEADLTKALALETATYDAAISSGTFTEGHVGAEALDEIFRCLVPGGRLIASINMEIWDEAGFGPKIEALTEAGTMQVAQAIPARAFAGGAEHFQILVMVKGENTAAGKL